MNEKTEFALRICVVLLTMLAPFLYLGFHGYELSVSTYWNSEWRPLYIISNAATSYFLFSLSNWKIPATFLMLLTAFAVDQYMFMHNFFAGCFFVFSFFCLLFSKRFKWYWKIYIVCSFIALINLLLGEILVIELIAMYHLQMLMHKKIIEKRRSHGKY